MMTDEYQKKAQALIKKIQMVAFIIAGIMVVVVVYTSISKWKTAKEEELTPLVSEKIVFTPPLKLTDAMEGVPYEYSFCQPKSARSGATCGGLAGATTNPYGGNPPYSFNHQFGVGFIPPGLALELNGLLRGTPTLPGDYTFGVCVTDLYEEVCKTTFLSVKPKSEQVEKSEEEVSLPEEEEEKITPSVKIESTSVTFRKRGFPEKDNYFCRVTMSGTATLLTDKTLSFSGCWEQPCIFGKNSGLNIGNYTDSIITCPSWTLKPSDCERRSGQPATGEWSITFWEWFYPWEGYKKTFFVYTTSKTDFVLDSVTLTCSP